jgi:hypothetical protein
MLFSIEKLTAVLSLATLITAAPAGNVARATQSLLPALIIPIESNAPDQSFGASTVVQVSNEMVVGSATYDDLLRFDNIPADAFWCHLALQFPDPSYLQISGAATLNVYTVDRNTTATDTWGNSPQKVSLVSSVNLQEGFSPEIVLTTDRCTPSLSYRLEIADLTKDGSIHFDQTDVSGFQLQLD